MSNFSSFIMTDEGRKIVAKANAEQENCIVYTKFICTDTRYNKEQLPTLKDIENPKQTINVQNVKYEAPDKARVTGKLSSSDLDNGYYLYTVGVYAKNKLDNKEVLYAVTIETEPEKVNWISSKSDLNVVDTIITAIFVISKAELSSVEVLPGDTVSQIVFDEHVNSKGRDEVHGATNEAENGMIISRDEEGSAKINMPTEPQDTTIVNKKYIDDKLANIDTDIDKSKVINIYNTETTYNPGDYVAIEFEVEDPPTELFAYKVVDKNNGTEINKLYYYESADKTTKYLSITGIPINLNIGNSDIPIYKVLIPMLMPVNGYISKELVSIALGNIFEDYTEDTSNMNDIQLTDYFNKALQKYKPLFNNYRYKYINGQIDIGDAVKNNRLIVNGKEVRGFIDFNLQKSSTGFGFHMINMYIDREDWDYEVAKQGAASINLPQIEYRLNITEKMKKSLISFYANNRIYPSIADLEKKTVDVMKPLHINKLNAGSSNPTYKSFILSTEEDLSKIFEINQENTQNKIYEAGKLNGMDIKIYQTNIEEPSISKRLWTLLVQAKDCETVIAESDSGKKYINALYMKQPVMIYEGSEFQVINDKTQEPINPKNKTLLYTIDISNYGGYGGSLTHKMKWTPPNPQMTNDNGAWGDAFMALGGTWNSRKAGEMIITKIDDSQFTMKGWYNNIIDNPDYIINETREAFFFVNTIKKIVPSLFNPKFEDDTLMNTDYNYVIFNWMPNTVNSLRVSPIEWSFSERAEYKIKKVEMYLYEY